MTIHAKITGYKDFIVCELIAKNSITGEVTTSLDDDNNIGQVIHNTKVHLGVSKEALELFKKVPRSGDDLGDVDWFKSGESYCFAWIGGPYSVHNTKNIEGSRTWAIHEGEYVEIPNDVPEAAKNAIER